MTRDIKHRPTFTTNELKLLASCLTDRLSKHIQAGDFNNPILLTVHKLKEYCESFVNTPVRASTDAERLAMYLQTHAIVAPSTNTGVDTTNTGANPNPVAVAALTNSIPNAVLNNPDLTDEQKFDLLNLRDSTQRTEEENIFMLNTGTMIMLKRASNKPVNPSDL